jgi:hypothetical protein
MVNKRVTSKDDPLIPTIIQLPRSQKDFLDTLDESASSFIRKLIGAQMSGHEAEISQLKEEARQHEAHLNQIKAQISELEAVDMRKQAAGETREQLLEKVTDRFIKGNQDINFKDRDFVRIFKNNLEGMNRKIGSNGEPVTHEELKTLTIKKAEARRMHIYE